MGNGGSQISWIELSRRGLCALMIITLSVAVTFSTAGAIEPPSVIVKWYVQLRYLESLLKIPDAIQAIQDAKTVTRHQFYKGNNDTAVVQKLLDDFTNEHMSNWWDCMDWVWEGICYHCDNWDCSFDEYKSYYYPVQTYEFTNKVFVSEYLSKSVFQALGQTDLSSYWYSAAASGATDELDRAANAIGGPSVHGSAQAINFPAVYNNILNANTAEQMEWRVVSTLAQTAHIFPVPGNACHWKKNLPQPIMSEASYIINYTRLESALNSIPMMMPAYWLYQQKFGAKLPSYGLGTNVALGLTSQNTFDTSLVLPIPNLFFATPHIGTDVGVTNMKGNEYTKKWIAQLLRSNQFGGKNGLFPQIFPIIKYGFTGREPSRFQWHSPNWMPGGCKEELPIHPLDSYGSYLDTLIPLPNAFMNPDYHPEYDKNDEGRATVTQWQWFRCCKAGYDVLYGDTPQYKY